MADASGFSEVRVSGKLIRSGIVVLMLAGCGSTSAAKGPTAAASPTPSPTAAASPTANPLPLEGVSAPAGVLSPAPSTTPHAAPELRDALDAILNGQPGSYDRIVALTNPQIDKLAGILCGAARRAAPLNRQDADNLADVLTHYFGVPYRDAVWASTMFFTVYCPDVIKV